MYFLVKPLSQQPIDLPSCDPWTCAKYCGTSVVKAIRLEFG